METLENDDVNIRITRHWFQPISEHLHLHVHVDMHNPKSQSFSFFFSTLAWTSEKNTRTLVWTKIFCYIFSAMKSETFKNALISVTSDNVLLVSRV